MTDGTVPAAAVTGRTVPAVIILPQVPRGRQPRSRDAPRGGIRGIRGDRRLPRAAEAPLGRIGARTRAGAAALAAAKADRNNSLSARIKYVSMLLSELCEANDALEILIKNGEPLQKRIDAMNKVREVADRLEQEVADELWPLPKYSELLFIY